MSSFVSLVILCQNPNPIIVLGTISVATQSDDSLGLDDIGLKRPEMSKDIQEIYESLVNFQKRDSSMMQSFSMPPQKKPLQQQDSLEDSDRLSDILAAYGIKPKSDENSIQVNRVPTGRKISPCHYTGHT